MKYIRDEYPRPQFRRENWLMLNGEWEFEFDDDNNGVARGLTSGNVALKRKIIVPFSYQCEASGIGETADHAVVWYRRKFTVKNKRCALLCFNGSDYITDVWINGNHALSHVGGYAPFSADVSEYIAEGENVIAVRCIDPADPTVPRGKQSWTGEPFACWYTPTSGIWQSVWIEFFNNDALESFTIQPDTNTLSFSGEAVTLYGKSEELSITVSYAGSVVKTVRIGLDGRHTRYAVNLMESDFVDERTFWTPESPNLYTVELQLFCGDYIADKVVTRFGMRNIDIDENNNITLNGKRLYQRLVLDQGYWRVSGLTPPDISAIKQDILDAKAMGFNGARKHQKFEDPYFYYYADELGFLTWCEMPSAYNYCNEEVNRIFCEWLEIVRAAMQFTSVICYVPLNESWGVRKIYSDIRQQDFAAALYYATKALDGSRLVSTNDGWENVSASDIVSVHDYAFDSENFGQKFAAENLDCVYPQDRKLMAKGQTAKSKPVLLTEFGGIAMKSEQKNGCWGYNAGASTAEEFYTRLDNLIKGLDATNFQGYCYTQLTDVQQEVNGLLDGDHKAKLDSDRLAKIFKNR